MALKFRKKYSLSVDLQGAGAATVVGPQLPTSPLAPDAPLSLNVRLPFTCEFSVNRNNMAEANDASFTVYGLGKSIRNFLRKDRYNTNIERAIEFWAGYDTPPTNVKLNRARSVGQQSPEQIAAEAAQLYTMVFRGNLYEAWSEREPGGMWRTQLSAQTGIFAFQHSHTARSYPAGTPKRQIILELIADLPGLLLGAVGNFPGSITRGTTYNGATIEAIKELTDGRFYVDNGRVYCLQDNEYLPASVPVISERSGLVGVPRKESSFVHVRTLFEPGLLVGQRVRLESQTSPENNGEYKLTGLSHVGVISAAVASTVFTTAQLTNYDPLMFEVHQG